MRFWRRKRRKMAKFNANALPAPTRISVARSIEEGVLLAEYSTRMQAKNQVIMGALRGEGTFDAEHYAGLVRDNLARLAAEATEQAVRVREVREDARGAQGLSEGHHDYRSGDVGNLLVRERSSAGLAAKLDELRADDDFVHGVVEAARLAAWDEVGDVVVSTLAEQNAPVDLGENYAEERLVRMQLLQLEDLQDLATERRAHGTRSSVGAASSLNPPDDDGAMPAGGEAAV